MDLDGPFSNICPLVVMSSTDIGVVYSFTKRKWSWNQKKWNSMSFYGFTDDM